MPVADRPKILFVSKWYPHDRDPINGIFVQKQAEAVAAFTPTAVLHVNSDPSLATGRYREEIQTIQDVLTVIVYYGTRNSGDHFISRIRKLFLYWKASRRGYRMIRQQFGRPDLVHVNILRRPGLLALYLKFTLGIPYLISEHWSGYLPADGSYRGFLIKLATKILIRQADAVITVSTALKKAMQAHGLYNRYFIVPNILETWPVEPFARQQKTPFKLLVITRLYEREKNIAGLIESIARLNRKKDQLFHLHIIGDGEDKGQLVRLAAGKDLLDSQVFFHGLVPNSDIYPFYRSSHVLVVNSHYETFSITAAEALANGMPVIVTDCGGPQDFVKAAYGITIPIGEPQRLDEAIWQMHRNYDQYLESVKEFDATPFSAKAVGEKLLNLYQSVLKNI